MDSRHCEIGADKQFFLCKPSESVRNITRPVGGGLAFAMHLRTVLPSIPSPLRQGPLPAICLLWIGLVIAGSAWMWRYELTPGEAGATPGIWPAASQLERKPGLPTLVMMAHPECPCTRASVAELAALMAEHPGRMVAHILFYQPEGSPMFGTKSASWQSAKAIPGVQILADPEGGEAARFGGETSGDIVLFDPAGRVVFHGGITAARGHLGPNPGVSAIQGLLAGASPSIPSGPVFGCPITGTTSLSKSQP